MVDSKEPASLSEISGTLANKSLKQEIVHAALCGINEPIVMLFHVLFCDLTDGGIKPYNKYTYADFFVLLDFSFCKRSQTRVLNSLFYKCGNLLYF